MTDSQINEAIAKWQGWVQEPYHYYADGIAWRRGDERCATIDLTDYCRDLNAVHEAESKLTEDECKGYLTTLNNMACRLHGCGNIGMCAYTVFATARQRCEALLRTLNLWKE